MSQAIILFAHGARDPEWAGPLLRLAEAVRHAEPGAQVRTAFLEFMTPDLVTAAEQAVHDGASTLIVVPVFLAQGGHVRRDVPLMLERIRTQHPGVHVELRAAIGEAQPVIDVMAQVVLGKV